MVGERVAGDGREKRRADTWEKVPKVPLWGLCPLSGQLAIH